MAQRQKHNLIIRDAMKKYKVYLYEVADLMGVSEPTICRWMRNEMPVSKQKSIALLIRKKVTDEKLMALAKS